MLVAPEIMWMSMAASSRVTKRHCLDASNSGWVVVSNILFFHPYLGRSSNLTDLFQMGWFNNQLGGLVVWTTLMIWSILKFALLSEAK